MVTRQVDCHRSNLNVMAGQYSSTSKGDVVLARTGAQDRPCSSGRRCGGHHVNGANDIRVFPYNDRLPWIVIRYTKSQTPKIFPAYFGYQTFPSLNHAVTVSKVVFPPVSITSPWQGMILSKSH